jgi:23S rRNA pseudouridine1911/1915/1917 synthase
VHLQHLGCPLLGDKVYGGRPARAIEKSTGFSPPRQMLHAQSLGFTHPVSGKKLTLEAPLPADFLDALNFLKDY